MATVHTPTLRERPKPSIPGAEQQSLWYKDAIIYQLHVRAFRDSDRDGVGDLRGLTQELDYIQDLGVTAIWLLPCFPSPLKDDGYDIADYTNIHPQYGTLADFVRFLEEAHRRDLRVITELVMNHTSDQHEWFQRSRRAAPGSRWRDWYVWNDTPEKYQEARIIFQDFETSNWSWDPVAGAYFWHRFYSHQPDLNFDNPEVREAMLRVLDFWLDLGVDALRLDAVPYLFEREGTNCENLPETHAFLREVRSHIDANFSDRMLLAEANQWPEDAASYFGDGDECHMNFHFPLMPRLYVAVEREDRFPIDDTLDQTPPIPDSCQWAIFLRNHDELTLEMVTDEERDYMYRMYALDSKMRINLGIRRRLAPLMSNDRRKIELMNALLFSLPGTPVIYYGDEIGMGDNYYLGDRNGVRTPMQWSADRNAGFSSAHPQSLYLPVIIDPEYHYEFRNVEMEQANPQSLLWWTRRTLDMRKQYQVFGRGSFEAVPAHNQKVFAFLRETDSDTVLVVANLSRFAQPAELNLSRFRGRTPTEFFGQSEFPAITDEPYRITLGPYGFYWFCIGCREKLEDQSVPATLPSIRGVGEFDDLLKGQSLRRFREALEPYLHQQRWFAGKARRLQSVDIIEAFAFDPSPAEEALVCLVITASYADGEPDSYIVPVMLVREDLAEDVLMEHRSAAILRIEMGNDIHCLLCEATWNNHFWRQLLEPLSQNRTVFGAYSALKATRTQAFAELWDETVLDQPPKIHGGQQSNTSATFDGRFICKLFRRITPGTNPDLEIGSLLTENRADVRIPRVAGAIEFRDRVGRPVTVAILHEFIENYGDAWTYTLDELGRYLERVQSRVPGQLANSPVVAKLKGGVLEAARAESPFSQSTDDESIEIVTSLRGMMESEPPLLAQETVGAYLLSAETLGHRLGELHVALAGIPDNPAFSCEPFTRLYQRGLYQSLRSQTRSTMELLRRQLGHLDDEARQQAGVVLESESQILQVLNKLTQSRIAAKRVRCHGDFHLGQVLYTGNDFVIIDFEGEPERPVSERRIKASPLKDVAGLVRSLHYASHAALRGQTSVMLVDHGTDLNRKWAAFWYAWTTASFLRAYLATAKSGRFLPDDAGQVRTLLTAYLIEKALYELRYELNNRPDWVNIPLEGILQLAGDHVD